MFLSGDSKTAQPWYPYLKTDLETALGESYTVAVSENGHEGFETSDLAAIIDADLAAISEEYQYAVVNIGINDLLHGNTDWSDMENQIGYVLDAIHAKWSGCKVCLDKIWSGSVAEATNDYFDNNVIPNVLATRSAWAFDGVDERISIKSDDNGATYTSDLTHYSNPAGFQQIAQVTADILTA